MIQATRWWLIVMFWLLAGLFLIADGASPVGVVLLLSGLTLPMVVSGRVFARSRARQGKPDDFSAGLADWTRLSRGDVARLALSMGLGMALIVSAVAVFGIGG